MSHTDSVIQWSERESCLLVRAESEGRTGYTVRRQAKGWNQESGATTELKDRARVMVRRQANGWSQESTNPKNNAGIIVGDKPVVRTRRQESGIQRQMGIRTGVEQARGG